ncbi:MAG: hypothetical protein AB1918_09225 [Pseudomonadota bacterium]
MRNLGWAPMAVRLGWLGMMYVTVTYAAMILLGLAQIHVSQGTKAGQIFQEVAAFDRAVEDKRAKRAALVERQEELSAAIDASRAQVYELAVTAGLAEDKVLAAMDGGLVAGVDPARVDLAKWAKGAVPLRDWIAEKERNATVLAALEAQLSAVNDSLDHVKGVVAGGSGGDELDRVRYTVQTLQDLVPLYPQAIFLPVEVLTLLLTLAMGALGATLQATREMVEGSGNGGEADCPLGCFLFRPFQGMVTACVVYIVFKAGQVTISTGDTEALNPFFVSFVGIVSGMFTSEAYQMIGRAARGLLRSAGGDEGARWGFGLAAAMAAQGISPERMAVDLGRDPSEVQGWVDEKAPVSAADQAVVAAYLRLRPRALFTSEAPQDGGKAEIAAVPS